MSREGEPCCLTCEDKSLAAMAPVPAMLARRFVVCLLCGNKRCPKATNHELACTKSNERGQKGSVYE